MDNQKVKDNEDFFCLQFMEATRMAILVPHLALCETLGTGITMEIDPNNEKYPAIILGIRTNMTAYMATYSEDKLLYCFFAFDKEAVELKSKLIIYRCESMEQSDILWPVLMEQVAEWTRCEREVIDIIGDDKNCA